MWSSWGNLASNRTATLKGDGASQTALMELTKVELKTRLEAAEKALHQAEIGATIGQLALEMVHEIRNSLEALGQLTYLAREDAGAPEKVRAYLTLAEEQMAHLRYISGKTLGYSKSAFSIESADLVKVAEAAVRIHKASLARNNIRLITDFPEEATAHIHFGGMLQVISNLLANAVDAVPAAGTIRIRVRVHENEVHILVADNGGGIPSKYIRSVFEPYFTTKGDQGTGIGLALVEKILKGHRGRIRVRSSVRPGRCGTTFLVSVPANPVGLLPHPTKLPK
jgi:signal transduction histidine kinase